MSTEKSVIKGTPEPGPVPKDSIRLYSMRFCPYAQRTRLVLHAKGIKFDTINIHLRNKPEWFLEKNPLGMVPTLETPAGEVIYESPITCEYLDEAYPEKNPAKNDAGQQMFLLKGEDVSGLEAELKVSLTKLDEHLVKKKTKFFDGDTITMIDYMLWPFFERIEMGDLEPFLDNTPELKKWRAHMLEDPAVKATIHSVESHKAFFKGYAVEKPDYDYGL
uniref:Glutathione S-transferase omega n=1 Tax=Poecilia latipinna TaxID=48699 RepID=A0A3B3U8Y7_9TELE